MEIKINIWDTYPLCLLSFVKRGYKAVAYEIRENTVSFQEMKNILLCIGTFILAFISGLMTLDVLFHIGGVTPNVIDSAWLSVLAQIFSVNMFILCLKKCEWEKL